MRRLVLFSVFLLGLGANTGSGQASAAGVSPRDTLFRRARRLVSEGNGAAGRVLADSLLRQSTEGTTAYGDALYWRGALAETAADAERDYRRVIVEYPASLYADDALLALVELEQARGDRAGALQHLQRFVREHQVSNPARGVAALAAARLAFDQRDTKTGCTMITDARASASATDVEMRNQIDYFGSRCTGEVAMTAPAPAASVTPSRDTVVPTPRRTAAKPQEKPTPKPLESPVPAKPRGSHTIQLAAFNTQAEADRLVAKLGKSGVSARVSGTAKPFRVRMGFYATRQAAQDEVVALKQRGIIGFVTTEEPPAEAKTP